MVFRNGLNKGCLLYTSTQGTKEKEINLQIAIKLKKRLEKEGMKVVMTREDDADLADKKASSQKVSDMRNRVKIIEDADPVVTISIHPVSYTHLPGKD